MLNFRELVFTIIPTWLRRGIAARLMFTLALYLDVLIELTASAVRLRFPGAYGSEPLPYLGRERRIRQGLGETDAHWAVRLQGYLETHKDRGGPYPMLEQIWEHYRYQPDGAFPVHLVYTSGARFDMGVDGVVTRHGFEGVGLGPEEWAVWKLVYEWPTPIATDGTWDDPGTYDDNGVWDSELTLDQVTDMRLIPTEWNNGYCFGQLVVLSPGQALWDVPVQLWDDGGTWDEDEADPVLVGIE